MDNCHKHLLIVFIVIFISSASSGEEIYLNVTHHLLESGTNTQSSYHTVSETVRYVTAYNVGDPNQNHGDPCISANGENICEALELGAKRCAANFVPFGTTLFIQAFGFCVVTDRTNSRYQNRVDIAMKSNERRKAKKFGKKKLHVKILKNSTSKSDNLKMSER